MGAGLVAAGERVQLTQEVQLLEAGMILQVRVKVLHRYRAARLIIRIREELRWGALARVRARPARPGLGEDSRILSLPTQSATAHSTHAGSL